MSDICSAIADDRRRDCIQVLAVLADTEDDDFIEAATVATILAGLQTETQLADISGDARERVYVALVQNHLPKLDECGVIEYYSRPKKIGLDDALHVVNGILLAISQVSTERQTRLEKIAQVVEK